MNKIIQGDCLEELRKLESNSIDSIVTDPPYGLAFMGKKWDSEVPGEHIWKECLRVLKPAGHLLSFGGTRTYHRMAYAIEQAGFEIRDMVEWVYGSGFPKSHNIGKAINKIDGVDFDSKPASGVGFMKPDSEDWHQTKNQLKQMGESSERAKQWEGWGTALKPAHEPIVLARKPIKTSVVENVLTWGTGGLNIDDCRIGYESESDKFGNGFCKAPIYGNQFAEGQSGFSSGRIHTPKQGRFPANLIHDGSEEVLNEFAKAGITKTGGGNKSNKKPLERNSQVIETVDNSIWKGDSGTPARFFKQCEFTEEDSSFIYCPKAGKKERNVGINEEDFQNTGRWNQGGEFQEVTKKGNHHPTVKPIKLMEYLIKLVTPKEGTVLDPFVGSGTTGIASAKQGMNFIGIEKEPEYVKIAEARIKPYLKQENLNKYQKKKKNE